MKFLARSRDTCKWEKNGKCTCPGCKMVHADKFEDEFNCYFCLHSSLLKENDQGCGFFVQG